MYQYVVLLVEKKSPVLARYDTQHLDVGQSALLYASMFMGLRYLIYICIYLYTLVYIFYIVV